jgi:protocatechuate 3,4-dioxygenase beta subunit
MTRPRPTFPTRRAFLGASLALPPLLAACVSGAADVSLPNPSSQAAAQPPAASPTPRPSVPNPPVPAAPTPVPATAPAGSPLAGSATVLQPTPACADDDDVTPAQTEGPYFTRNSPSRASLLETGMAGTRLTLAGRVLSTDCRPVARALLDFWQADDRGQYDNVGYRLRGHQFAGDDGAFRLETIVPGLYPGRTRHIHVKVQAPNRPVLTTQLYFPDEPRNRQDGIFHADLVMDVRDTSSGKAAAFDFVLRLT